jgi:hypothetical protein
MKLRRMLAALAACGLLIAAVGAASAQAVKKAPKPKDYTYCVKSGNESECFTPPFEVFQKTATWTFEETTGTYTRSGRRYDFRETGGPDELIGTKVQHGVIAGTLFENGKPTEFTFTLTPVAKA